MILVACEFSGIVRDELRSRGLDAVSCDLLPSERPGPHLCADVLEVLRVYSAPAKGAERISAVLAFPPCTYLARSGIHWNSRIPGRAEKTEAAIAFVRTLWEAAPVVAIENPIGVLSTRWQRPTQVIQPWEHGEAAVKSTCLWLKGLPALTPSRVVEATGSAALDYRGSHKNRARERSRTYQGVARAMASQWAPALREAERALSL